MLTGCLCDCHWENVMVWFNTSFDTISNSIVEQSLHVLLIHATGQVSGSDVTTELLHNIKRTSSLHDDGKLEVTWDICIKKCQVRWC